jgi:hypothetical protein
MSDTKIEEYVFIPSAQTTKLSFFLGAINIIYVERTQIEVGYLMTLSVK